MTIRKSIKGNFIWNSTRIFMSIIFPLISFPYVSRILGADGLGKVNYISSISAFFVMFALLGVPTYAIREGAKVRDDKEKLGKFATEVFIISIISSIISLLVYSYLLSNPKFSNYKALLIVFGFTVPFSVIGITWLYQIVEDYKRIAIQSVIFQLISIIMLFVFVRDKGDYIHFALITVFSSVGSNFLYLINSRKYIKLFGYKEYSFKRHLKPIFIIFGMSVASSIYLNFDVTMLGFMKNDTTVGLYSAAVKITRIVAILVSSLSTVILSRLSYYVQNNSLEKFESLLYKTSNFILLLAIPASIGLFLLSEQLIIVFSGEEFIEASITMKIMSITVLFSPINALIAYQVFMPFDKEKYSLYAVLVGCIVNFFLNLIVIPKFAQNGAALTTVLAEICVFIIGIYFCRRLIDIKKLFYGTQKYIISSSIIVIIYLLVIATIKSIILQIIIISIVGGLLYFIMLIIMKNKLVIEILKMIKS